MQQFIKKFQDHGAGMLTGFDRVLFRGSLRRLNFGYWDQKLGAMVAKGMEEYLWQNKILFKDYAQHVKQASEKLKSSSLQPFREQGLPVVFLRSPPVDKEALARGIAATNQTRTGLVCALSAVESSPAFEHRNTHIIRRERPCHPTVSLPDPSAGRLELRPGADLASFQTFRLESMAGNGWLGKWIEPA